EEVNKGGLHLGLARLEIITTNERAVSLGEIDDTWNKSVLWGAVDEWDTLLDTGNGEDGRWGNLIMASLDSSENVVGSVVNTVNQVGVTLSVGSPKDDNLVESILSLEVTRKPVKLCN